MSGILNQQPKIGPLLPEEVLPVSIELMDKYIETSENHISTVTMAPEIENADKLISYLTRKQINVCLGHSNATYAEAKKAVDLGAVITQKTGNCMRGMHHREMGLLGAALLEQGLYNEVNSDLAHVSKEFLTMIYRLKGPQKNLYRCRFRGHVGHAQRRISASGQRYLSCWTRRTLAHCRLDD